MSTVKTVKYQVGTDGTSSNNFTIYQPDPPDGTMRIGVGNADNPTEVGQFNANGYKPAANTVPVFEVFKGDADQTVSSATQTKVIFSNVDYDLTSDWDATNNRFQPSVAGYYQFNTQIYVGGTITRKILFLRKNGTQNKILQDFATSRVISRESLGTIFYLNGSTDYVEVYIYLTGSLDVLYSTDGSSTYLNGYLIQQA